jgi:hypothetical protein
MPVHEKSLSIPVMLSIPPCPDPVLGKIKRLFKSSLVVFSSNSLPREHRCELAFILNPGQPVRILCSVQENVHTRSGFEIYLKIIAHFDQRSASALAALKGAR